MYSLLSRRKRGRKEGRAERERWKVEGRGMCFHRFHKFYFKLRPTFLSVVFQFFMDKQTYEQMLVRTIPALLSMAGMQCFH